MALRHSVWLCHAHWHGALVIRCLSSAVNASVLRIRTPKRWRHAALISYQDWWCLLLTDPHRSTTHAIRGTSNGRAWNKFRWRIQLFGFWFFFDEWPAFFICAPYENSAGKGESDPESYPMKLRPTFRLEYGNSILLRNISEYTSTFPLSFWS